MSFPRFLRPRIGAESGTAAEVCVSVSVIVYIVRTLLVLPDFNVCESAFYCLLTVDLCACAPCACVRVSVLNVCECVCA